MHWNPVRKLVNYWELVFNSPSVPARIYYLALAKSVVCCCLRSWVCYTTLSLPLHWRYSHLAFQHHHGCPRPDLGCGCHHEAKPVPKVTFVTEVPCWRAAICWGQWQRKSSWTFETWRTSLWCVYNQYFDLEVELEKAIRPFLCKLLLFWKRNSYHWSRQNFPEGTAAPAECALGRGVRSKGEPGKKWRISAALTSLCFSLPKRT